MGRSSKTELLDLADEMLVAILDRVCDLRSIIRSGAVSKRLNRLHFLASRISASFEPGEPGEGKLLCFLTSLVENGGCLRELKFWSLEPLHWELEDWSLHRQETSASLGWIEPVTSHLRSVELDYRSMSCRIDRFVDIFTRSPLLVKLRVLCYAGIRPSQVAQVVASCPCLRVMEIRSHNVYDEVMELSSSSLQEIGLALHVSVALDTPALRRLDISVASLKVQAHSLKRLKLDTDSPLRLINGISPPLADLEFLWLHKLEDLENVLRRIEGGCLKVLHIETSEFTRRNLSADLTSLECLKCLRSLEIGCRSMEAFANGTDPRQAAQLLARLGVEEMVVELGVDFLTAESCPNVVRNWKLLLCSLLSSRSPLRKLVVESYYEIVHEALEVVPILVEHRWLLQDLLSYLLEHFPGVVISVVDNRPSKCFRLRF